MIHIFIIDHILINCEALSHLLNQEADMRVVSAATETDAALAQMAAIDCHVAIVSANLPEGGALQLTEQIGAEDARVNVIIAAMPDSPAIIMRYIEAGAVGYLLQHESTTVLLEKVRAAFDGRALVTPVMAAHLIERAVSLAERLDSLGIDPADYAALTGREKEILQLIADGMTNQEIAAALTIELGTVKNHVHSILGKLDVHTRQDAAIYLSLLEHRDR
ncbi:MAG: response regulator transcription factor [Caldilineaceae bacterium]